MTRSQESFSAGFYYLDFHREILDIKDIAKTFDADAAAISKNHSSTRDVLWEGIFGMFEGPQIARFHSSSETLAWRGLVARNGHSYKTVAGIPIAQKQRSSEITYEQPGPVLTALAAYATKLEEDSHHSTVIRIPYSGVDIRPDGDTSTVATPYGIPDVTATLLPHHQTRSRGETEGQDALFFYGTMAIGNERLASLPAVMLGQMAVINEATRDTNGQSIVERTYGGDIEAVSYAWEGAMAQDSPRQAARYILNNLPG
jgi:hypothetical protein